MNNIIRIPFSKGLQLVCEPGYEQSLGIALAHLSSAMEAVTRSQNSPLLSEYINTVVARFLRETHYSAKSASMLSSRFNKLQQILVGDNASKKVCELGDHDVRALKAELPSLLRQNSRSESQGSNIEAYYRLFNRLIAEAVDDGFLTTIFKISATRTKRSKISKPFSDSDIDALLAGWPYQSEKRLNFDAHSYRFWLMPLALLTGGRLNELCQLRVNDVIQDTNGIQLLCINNNGHNKSLKNEQSRRQIPICSLLKKIGFLEFVAEQRAEIGSDGPLFPELRFDAKHLYSRGPSRFFCGSRTGEGYIGKQCAHTKDGGWNFKSFRRTFALRLESSGISSSTIAYLLGHRGGSSLVTDKHYLDRPLSVRTLEQLEEGLKYKFDHENLRWSNFKAIRANQKGRLKRGRPDVK